MNATATTQIVERTARRADDFTLPMVAIVSIGPAGGDAFKELPALSANLTRHGGQVLEATGSGILAVFERLDAATACVRALQDRMVTAGDLNLAIGINLGSASGPESARDIAYAHRLRQLAAPGDICISAVSTDRLTSRVRASGRNEPTGWRACILPAIGLTGLLGYFFGWFYALYWKMAYSVLHGGFPCWPDFMCG